MVGGAAYHFGGIYVGGAFVGSFIYSWANGLPDVSLSTMIVTAILLVLLLAIIGMSMPQLRAIYHDPFERRTYCALWAAADAQERVQAF